MIFTNISVHVKYFHDHFSLCSKAILDLWSLPIRTKASVTFIPSISLIQNLVSEALTRSLRTQEDNFTRLWTSALMTSSPRTFSMMGSVFSWSA